MKKDPHDVGKVEHFYRRVLHILELMIAAIAIVVLIISSIGKKRENQPPAALGLPYFREER